MTFTRDSGWRRLLLPCLAIALVASAAHAEEPKVVRKVVQLEDCPGVKILGTGGVHMLSLSPRGFLGVETSNLTPELRRHFGVPEDAGVMLSRVVDDSAASAAGLEVGDVVTRIDGDAIASGSQLGSTIRQLEGGAVVELEYWRDGEKHLTSATLEERERCAFDVSGILENIDLEQLPKLSDLDINISGEAIEDALRNAREVLQSQDWEKHFEQLKDIDLERIEERMEDVQRRLEELEERLESASRPQGSDGSD